VILKSYFHSGVEALDGGANFSNIARQLEKTPEQVCLKACIIIVVNHDSGTNYD